MKYFLTGLIIAIIALTASLFITYQRYQGALQAKKQTEEMLAEENRLPTLPPGVVKLSECIPFEGEHWVLPKDLPYGPFYSTYNGKVISTEYMFTPDEIPGEQGAKMSFEDTIKFMKSKNLSFGDVVKSSLFGFDLFGHKYKTFDMHWSAPHAGFDATHFDVHFFFVDRSERDKICPDAKIENVYSQDIMHAIDQHHIPFPGKTSPSPSTSVSKPSMEPTGAMMMH